MYLNIKSPLDDVLNILKKDINGDDDTDGSLYSQVLIKKLTYVHQPLEIRFIDTVGMGFYSMNIAGESVENVFNALMSLHCNYSINFDYFTKIMTFLSDVISNAYAVKKPFKALNLTGANWQDGYIRYNQANNLSHCYTFNINGLPTILNDQKIAYDIEPSILYEKSAFNGSIGYFNFENDESYRSGFVMKMQCSCRSIIDNSVANYSFFVSLDENNPFILMGDGKLITEERFKYHTKQHVYKLFHRAFSLTGVGPGTITELQAFTRTEMKDLVQIHEMVKM